MKDNRPLTTWKSSLSVIRNQLRFGKRKSKDSKSIKTTLETSNRSCAQVANNVSLKDKTTSMRTRTHSIERWPFSVNSPRNLFENSYQQRLENDWKEHKAWRKVFAEYLFYELGRYDEEDAQRLKNQLTMACLSFKKSNKM